MQSFNQLKSSYGTYLSGTVLLGLFFILTAETCNSRGGGLACDHLATVVDRSDLDGCQILLNAGEDRLLLPTNLDTFDVEVGDGDLVTISFTVDDAAASICMAEDAIVTLQCIRPVIQKRSSMEDCPAVGDPYGEKWSRVAMQKSGATRIESMQVGNTTLYHFSGGSENRIYSCYGDHLCSYPAGNRTPCEEYFQQVAESTIIFVEDQ